MATTWDPSYKTTNIVLSGGNLVATVDAPPNNGFVCATESRSTGKFYFEVEMTDNNNGTETDSSPAITLVPIYYWDSVIYFSPVNVSFQDNLYIFSYTDTVASISESFRSTDGLVVQFAIDLDNDRFWIGFNGTWWNSGNPAAGTNYYSASFTDAVFPRLYIGSAGSIITGRFLRSSFSYSVPSGFSPWDASQDYIPSVDLLLTAVVPSYYTRAQLLHTALYANENLYCHRTSYYLGDFIFRLQTVDWSTVVSQAHVVTYESVLTLFAESFTNHSVYYEVNNPILFIADQRLHESNYTVFTQSFQLHESNYTVFTLPFQFHEILYQSVTINNRLHLSRWQGEESSQSRLHEIRYHVVDTIVVTESGSITFSDTLGKNYDFLAITITADEDSAYWQCEISLKDAQNYILFPRDTPFIINLLGVEFHFIVDSRTLERSIDDAGNYQESCTLSGLSPLVNFASPRAIKITKTWESPTLASALVTELIGTVTWNLIDWTIPAYRLAADNASPLDIAKQIVEAIGGLIESQPNGSIVCRHRWPVSIAELSNATVDDSFDERWIFSASEEPTQDELIDKIRIYDTEAGFQDRLEYVPNKIGDSDDPLHGILYAFPSPWRTGLRMVTTRPSVIHIGTMTEGTRSIVSSSDDYPPEILTFTERTASTQYPIMSLTALDWLDEDLGSTSFTPYATTLESGAGSYSGYSLAEVQYVTRYLSVPVTCSETIESIEAQFLLLEDVQDG